MAALAELDAAPDTIEAELSYLAKPEKLVTYVAKPGGVDEREGGETITRSRHASITAGRSPTGSSSSARASASCRTTAGSPIS